MASSKIAHRDTHSSRSSPPRMPSISENHESHVTTPVAPPKLHHRHPSPPSIANPDAIHVAGSRLDGAQTAYPLPPPYLFATHLPPRYQDVAEERTRWRRRPSGDTATPREKEMGSDDLRRRRFWFAIGVALLLIVLVALAVGLSVGLTNKYVFPPLQIANMQSLLAHTED